MIQRLYYLFKDILRTIKFGFQRMFRGYDDRAYYNLYYYLSEICVPSLDKMIKNGCGSPPHYTLKEWRRRLRTMKKSFELILEDRITYSFECGNKINEGLKMFYQDFRTLWD